MTELEKYQAVNDTKSLEELADVIESFADEYGQIQGKYELHDAGLMAERCRKLVGFDLWKSYITLGRIRLGQLTRKYGIRQQAIYLKTYKRD